MVSTQRRNGRVLYLEEDGQVRESDQHYTQAVDLIQVLRGFFKADSSVFTRGNL